MAAVLVDDILVGYCDTSRKIVEPKQAWVKKLFEDDPQHLQMFTQQCVEGTAIYFKNTVDHLKQQYNQSEGKYVNYNFIFSYIFFFYNNGTTITCLPTVTHQW